MPELEPRMIPNRNQPRPTRVDSGRIPPGRFARVACIVLGLAGLLTMIGCQSAPVLAWQGARHYASGNAALDRGEAQTAIGEFERAAELVPHASEIRNHLGLAYWAAGQPDRARQAFEIALELDCENEASKLNLARLAGVDVQIGATVGGGAERDHRVEGIDQDVK